MIKNIYFLNLLYNTSNVSVSLFFMSPHIEKEQKSGDSKAVCVARHGIIDNLFQKDAKALPPPHLINNDS